MRAAAAEGGSASADSATAGKKIKHYALTLKKPMGMVLADKGGRGALLLPSCLGPSCQRSRLAVVQISVAVVQISAVFNTRQGKHLQWSWRSLWRGVMQRRLAFT